MTPDITIEYKGYPGCEWGRECLPTGSSISTYVTGFVKTAEAALKEYPGQTILFEAINEPYGYGTASEYAAIVAKLLPEAEKAGIPLANIYIAGYGKRWIAKMYEAQSKLETEVQGWYFHPYGPPKGTSGENSEGIQSLPYVQAEMTSGQNNIIVSEVGYCSEDVHSGEDCHGDTVANSTIAAADLTEMLDNALPYHQAGWLRDLIVYSRNDGGWAAQLEGGALTAQGEALDSFADSYGLGWWSIQSTENPTEYAYLRGDSCVSEGFCAAVGGTENTSGVTLAETWNVTTWTHQTTPNPTGEVNFIELKDVSCLTKAACTAVGTYQGRDVGSFAERWNGSKWTFESTPSHEAGYALWSISCTSEKSCIAVGYQKRAKEMPIAARWNGEKWTIESPSIPPGGTEGRFDSVSCASGTFCIAVGDYHVEESEEPLVERWNGETWSIQSTPSIFGWLDAVSCTSTTSCGAVGHEEWGSPVAEILSGSSWSLYRPVLPTGASREYSGLSGISCISAARCTAVGEYGISGENRAPFASTWNGSFWSLQSMPAPAGTFTSLFDVSCTALTACTSVGSSTPKAFRGATLAERFSG